MWHRSAMPDARVVEWIRDKYSALVHELDERGRRRWAAAEAVSLGRGGIAAVAAATGQSDRTVRNGIRELRAQASLCPSRQRKQGAGRRRREFEQPGLMSSLESLIEPTTRGDPQSPLRWTCKSLRNLASELRRQGFRVGRSKVSELLRATGYSLQANRKTREGKDHPDRDAQFRHINRRVMAYRRAGHPAISVDTKKKETLGRKKNSGQEYRRKGSPREVDTHDFPDPEMGKAVPYGVYDLEHNEAWVSVGVSHDTAEFAVASIRKWWQQLGKRRYKAPRRLLVTADSGGSNAVRNRLWKLELQHLADRTGMVIEVCHFPPGTSKWNKIEHRLFCHITSNWRGIPLETHEIVVQLVNSTRTDQGLEVHCWLDASTYEKARKVNDEEFGMIRIRRNKFHGDWNYCITPRKSQRTR